MPEENTQSLPQQKADGGDDNLAGGEGAPCVCPCPDGIGVHFLVEWDMVGPVNPNLLEAELEAQGRVSNPEGDPEGETVEIEGSADVHVDFENDKLGQAASGNIIINFTLKPFFKDGFDEDKCCITAVGAFKGTVHIESYTDRDKPTEKVEIGDDEIDETIAIGACADPKKECCKKTYEWDYDQSFSVNALGFDIETQVKGKITITLTVWELVE